MIVISCKHPKFPDTLYVTNHPTRKKDPVLYSGSIAKAHDFESIAHALNVRDDVLEHKKNVVIQRH